MLLADARLPTGAHTQSAGWEPALRAGVPTSAVPEYMRARLATVTAVEAAAAVLARAETAYAATTPNYDLADALRRIDRAWRARTVSLALRETSVLLGRGYFRLVTRLWPGTAGARAVEAIGRPGRAVALGVAGALAGLTALQVARLVGYEDAQTIASAALKLEPLDPLTATGWVMTAAPAIERMAQAVAGVTDSSQMPAHGAPQIEQWAEIHATTRQRLFRA